MPLRSFCLLLVALAAPALGQEADEELRPARHVSPTPAWLPRQVFAGTYFRSGVVTLQGRLQWEVTVIQERVDAFVLFAEAGGGAAVRLTQQAGLTGNIAMTRFSQFAGVVGVAYRGTQSNGLHLGVQAGAGPYLYSARYAEFLLPEEAVAGIVEARVQVGYAFGLVAVGLSAGYGEAFGIPQRINARPFAGGLLVGLFADWR
jgi:hypothetical protein